MSGLRKAERIVGVAVGVLGLAGVVAGALIPVSSSTFTVHRGTQLIASEYHATSVFQYLGLATAVSVLVLYAALLLAVAFAAFVHSPDRDRMSLVVVWIGAALLAAATAAGGIVFAYLFWFATIFALMAAILATANTWRRGGLLPR